MDDALAVLILAAGRSTRMKSDLAKVLHPLQGRPMLAHVLETARALRPVRIVVVVGHQAAQVRAACGAPDVTFVLQQPQQGTGHAVAQARGALAGFQGTILILYGDVPLVRPSTLTRFLENHAKIHSRLSLLSVDLPDPGAYGRVIRDPEGRPLRVVEARDAGPEELAVPEINTGLYAVEAGLLFDLIERLKPDNDQQEYYLTDIIGLARGQNAPLAVFKAPVPEEGLGINTLDELQWSEEYLRKRVEEK
jgi:UDP-N-acetylglucosamine diphosphorylase/glucosamine-1-phosphate N-acetyltransferase